MKKFLLNLFERVGLVEAPMPPPCSAHLTLAEPQRLRPILLRLAAWGVKQIQLVVRDIADADNLAQTVRQALELDMTVAVRGRATDLAADSLLDELAAAGACEVEFPLLSAFAQIHDPLAGVGDHRCALKLLDAIGCGAGVPPANSAGTARPAAGTAAPRSAVQLVLTPSTWKTIGRTMELLDDRGVGIIRVWAIACRDDEPSSWAMSASELTAAAQWFEAHAPSGMVITWYPPLRFDTRRTLAEHVRRGPRAARDAVRVEADGSVIPPIGPAVAGGNVSQNDWKLIARNDVFRAWKRQRESVKRCEQCPGIAACARGCLRDEVNWTTE